MISPISSISVISLGCLLAACGSDASGEGSVAFDTWGEEYIETSIPSEEFEDGWSVKYDEFLIVLGEVVVDKQDGTHGASIPGVALYDLTRPGPHPVGAVDGLEEGNWDDVSFASLVADADTQLADSADADDLELMVDGGYNVYVSGTASKADTEKHFAWGVSEPVRYASCVDVESGQETSGVIVSDGSETRAQLTIHGDHLFYDDLASPEAKLRFEVIAAADADQDGDVTLEELAAVELSDLGSDAGPYGVGASDVDDMGAFVAAATTSLGHFNGEGHCRPERP